MIPVGEPPAIWPSLEQAEDALEELRKAPRFGGQAGPIAVLSSFLEAWRLKVETSTAVFPHISGPLLEEAFQAGYFCADDAGGLLMVSLDDFLQFDLRVRI